MTTDPEHRPAPGKDSAKVRSARVAEQLGRGTGVPPGQRADLPPGALPGVPLMPHADENRDPPPNAPTLPP